MLMIVCYNCMLHCSCFAWNVQYAQLNVQKLESMVMDRFQCGLKSPHMKFSCAWRWAVEGAFEQHVKCM